MIQSIIRSIKRQNGTRGQAMILIVFSIIGLIGVSALAIDGGNAFLDRRKAETAADAAALTGAITRIEGGNWRAAALAAAASNGYDNNGTTNTVELNTPPLNGPYAGNSEYIEVILTSRLSTYFGSVVGIPQITNVVKAVSQSKPAMYGPIFDGYALVSLAPNSNCDKQLSFVIQGEATISLEGGGVFVNSDNRKCAFIQFGEGSVRINDQSPITVVGGAQVQKPRLITPFPMQTGAAPIPYPPAFEMPKPSCGTKEAAVDELTGNMTPGSWGGEDFPPIGVHELQAGVYCIGGNVVVADGNRLIGNGVVLFVERGEVRISGSAEVQLDAPKKGPNAGLLIYMPITNRSALVLNGNLNSTYTGTILAPSANIRLKGLESKRGFHSQIIGYTIGVDGTSNIIIKYKDDENYNAYKMPEVLLSQ